jgi:hypothetical protein
MATTDLVNLLFTEILKIDPSTLYKYATLQDQILYLFLIPHVILFLFLYAFSFGIVRRVVGEHKGFSYLVGIVSYIYIIYASWYGKLVVWFLNWLIIALGLAVFVFFFSIILHPAATSAALKLAGEAGKELAKKTMGKEHEKRAIEEEVESIKKQIAAISSELGNPGIEPTAKAYLQMQKANLEAQRRALESKL